MENNKLSYEEAFEELESIIGKLGKDEIELSESVELFKKGVELYKYCNKLLSNAEDEVKLLLVNTEKLLNEAGSVEEVEKDNL